MDLHFWFVLLAGMAIGAGATLAVQWLIRREDHADDYNPAWEDVRSAMRVITDEQVPEDVLYVINPATMMKLPPMEYEWDGADAGDDAMKARLLWSGDLTAAKLRHPSAVKITDIGSGS